MRLRTSRQTDDPGIHDGGGRGGIPRGLAGWKMIGWVRGIAVLAIASRRVSMRWDLGRDERVIFLSCLLPENVVAQAGTLPGADRDAPAQVRQGEGGRAIAALGGAQQRKQSRVLVNWQKLALAKRPPARGKVKR